MQFVPDESTLGVFSHCFVLYVLRNHILEDLLHNPPGTRGKAVWSGSSLLSLKMVFFQSLGTSHNSHDLLKTVESSLAMKGANSDGAYLGPWTCVYPISFSGS